MFGEQEYNEVSGTSKAVLSFIGGMAIGYGIALLFAPRTGRETRQMLSDYAQTTGDAISSLARSAMSSTREAVAGAQKRAGEYADQGREAVRDAQARASAAVRPD